jgi:hypothetical protein
MYNLLFVMVCCILVICLHVLSDPPIDRPSNSLVGVPYSSQYNAHFSFHSKFDQMFQPNASSLLTYSLTHSQIGGLQQIWLLKCFASLLALQPILLSLIPSQ